MSTTTYTSPPVTALQAIGDPASPSAGQLWLSTTTSNVMKYADNAATPAIHQIAALDIAATWTVLQTFTAVPAIQFGTDFVMGSYTSTGGNLEMFVQTVAASIHGPSGHTTELDILQKGSTASVGDFVSAVRVGTDIRADNTNWELFEFGYNYQQKFTCQVDASGTGTVRPMLFNMKNTGTGLFVEVFRMTTDPFLQLAADMTASTDAARSIGTSTNRFLQASFSSNVRIFAGNDVNPTSSLESKILKFGAGGGTALQVGIGVDSSGNLGVYAPVATENFYINTNGFIVWLQGGSNPDNAKPFIGADAAAGDLILNAGTSKLIQLAVGGSGVLNYNGTSGVSRLYGISTAGLGIGAIYGVDNRSGLTAADGSTTTIYPVPAGAGKLFRVTVDIFATAYTSGTATYTLTWTQNAVTRTLVVTAAALNTLGTATDMINPDASTNITVQLTGTFTATVTVAAVAEQLA